MSGRESSRVVASVERMRGWQGISSDEADRQGNVRRGLDVERVVRWRGGDLLQETLQEDEGRYSGIPAPKWTLTPALFLADIISTIFFLFPSGQQFFSTSFLWAATPVCQVVFRAPISAGEPLSCIPPPIHPSSLGSRQLVLQFQRRSVSSSLFLQVGISVFSSSHDDTPPEKKSSFLLLRLAACRCYWLLDSLNYKSPKVNGWAAAMVRLAIGQRIPSNVVSTPKSSRLKNKHRCVGETMIKETFVQNVIQNNNLLNILLDDGSSCVILPQRTSDDCSQFSSGLHLKLQMKVKPRIALGLCHGEDKADGDLVSDLSVGSRRTWARCLNGFSPAEENSLSMYQRVNLSTTKISVFGSSQSSYLSSKVQNKEGQNIELQTVGVLDKGLLSCVTCGILSYACMAIIQPRDAVVGCLLSANSNCANQIAVFEGCCDFNNEAIMEAVDSDVDINLGYKEKSHSSVQVPFSSDGLRIDSTVERGTSALDLLASAYGDLSDSEENALCEASFCAHENKLIYSSLFCDVDHTSICPIDSESISHNWLISKEGQACLTANSQNRATGILSSLSTLDHSSNTISNGSYRSKFSQFHGNDCFESSPEEKMTQQPANQQDTIAKAVPSRLEEYIKMTTHSFCKPVGVVSSRNACRDLDIPYEIDSSGFYTAGSLNNSTIAGSTASTNLSNLDDSIKNSSMTLVQTSDKNSSRMHVFCLEHAVEVEKRLRVVGGANLMILCHPEYPKMESEAKHLAEELGLDHQWKEVQYRNACQLDQEKIRMVIEDEAVVPCNGDWAVKLGINLYYSVNLSQSPLFRKQMPYNEVIYKSFSQQLPEGQNRSVGVAGRRKKVIFAGNWCGKVWMSNQVHPYLADQTPADVDDERGPSSDPGSSYKGNVNRSIITRSLTNITATAKRKSGKNRRKPVKKSAHSVVHSSIDPTKNAEEWSKADKDMLPRRNLANKNGAAKTKSDRKRSRLSAVRSSAVELGDTRLEEGPDENYGSAEDADGDRDEDRSGGDTDVVGGKQSILSRRNSKNANDSGRWKTYERRRYTCTLSAGKPAHCLLGAIDAKCAEENSRNAGYVDDEMNINLSSKPDIDSETKNLTVILPRRNLTSNNAAGRRKSVRKRKRSNSGCTRNAAHPKDGDAEEFPAKCGRSLSFLREPSNILLRRRRSYSGEAETIAAAPEKRNSGRKTKRKMQSAAPGKVEFPCIVDGCTMSFRTKHDLTLHKRNVCPEKGCGKKFFSHKYLLQHRKVHSDDRPLRCPWKGCKVAFKWAWARTEHIRVHTGERPYTCKELGCGLTFRFVSDFSRHRRKTGHG
ncbi:Lysine-specific demethylase REF6 [Platanthera zijinensis]|uniref:Lysine-specific demethylase REF6 n=1 Tax=Platanthera zijinensis TaxID=2320716 RepID=A0AAP0G0A4_9ASPA